MVPKISICVPNLNTRPFLAERFRTIDEQSCQDWELLVYDSYSDDGAWEFIRGLATREPRMRAWQGPRQGTPGSWTPCVREARGEYVYIATSDDTMAPDCLEKLAAALDAHPECDIAHCALRAVDEYGRDLSRQCEWWATASAFAQSSGALINRVHIRKAPFDGLLHLLGGSVYISITQLLIRRSLFDRVGHFASTWGSVGDFNWGMRAGLVANTVHVPDTWGGWRVHSAQATAAVSLGSDDHARKIDAMIDDAIDTCEAQLPAGLRRQLLTTWAPRARLWRTFTREVDRRRERSRWERVAFLVRRLLAGSAPARAYIAARISGRPAAAWVQRSLDKAGYGPSLLPAVLSRPAAPAIDSLR